MSKRDYYEVLGVVKTATDVEIKSAYRKLAMKHHPDKNPGDHTAEDKFKEAAEAYAILADAEKRTLYDRYGHAGVTSAAGGGFDPSVFNGFEDILGNLGDIFGFGDLFGGRRRGGPQRGGHLRYDLEITFEESARGAETSIQIPRQENCETCRGSGAAPGSSASACPQCRGQGQVRFQQGFFTVARTCPQCRGAGKIITKPCQTCRGAGRVSRERKITVKIPEGTQTGTTLRLRSKGMPDVSGRGRGDLFATVQVLTPKKLSREQRHLLDQLAKVLPAVRSRSARSIVNVSGTLTATNRSPAGPPADPPSPSPCTRSCWPVAMPAGILTLILRSRATRPAPRQV